ncbi:hypothetical protein ACFXGA_27020 [Actinosynnema sp. NPDC059335]|uniref:hypothetical protein n=1 Tax=Actinosynnema sp. NPDC059335 TaxID=3346804 RepID=UPI00366CD411
MDRVDLDPVVGFGGVSGGTIAAAVSLGGAGVVEVEVVVAGVVRVEATGGVCWLDGLPAVAGERLPGRRRRVRLLCELHDAAVFGGPEAVARVRARRAASVSVGAADAGGLVAAEARTRR